MEKLTGLLIDSDILIDYLRGFEKARSFLVDLSRKKIFYLSVVSVVEIYSGRETRDQKRRERIDAFLQNFEIIKLEALVAKSAGELRRDYQKPFADMIIAATALTYNIPLATRNIRHFQGIKSLKVSSPY